MSRDQGERLAVVRDDALSYAMSGRSEGLASPSVSVAAFRPDPPEAVRLIPSPREGLSSEDD
jgi:hypothetical protein